VGGLGGVFERGLLRRLYGLDPIYGLLLTFGLVLVIEGGFRVAFGTSGQDSWTFRWDRRIYVPHTVPAECSGHEDDNFCALGSKVDPEVDRGVVEFTPLDEEGDALDAVEVSFSLDQGESEVEIVLE
jgi:hypothetical protein